jgi:hypothetical protein
MVAPASSPVITITNSGVGIVPLALVGANNRTGSGTISSDVGARLAELRRRSSTEEVDWDVNAGKWDLCARGCAECPLEGAQLAPLLAPRHTR